VCCLRNPRNRRSTRLCLWGSLGPRASIAVQAATVPDIARPDSMLIASRIWGIKMIFLRQPNLTPLRVVGGRLRAARALVSLFLGRCEAQLVDAR
jgi:hypothetical protein